jgi:DctM-like transporters.
MEWFESLGLLIGSILVLMAIGMPVALAFLAANVIGAWLFMGGARGVTLMLNNGFGSLTNFALVPIPLFLLMGEIFLSHRPWRADVQCNRQAVGPVVGAFKLCDGAGRYGVFDLVRVVDGVDRAFGVADGS